MSLDGGCPSTRHTTVINCAICAPIKTQIRIMDPIASEPSESETKTTESGDFRQCVLGITLSDFALSQLDDADEKQGALVSGSAPDAGLCHRLCTLALLLLALPLLASLTLRPWRWPACVAADGAHAKRCSAAVSTTRNTSWTFCLQARQQVVRAALLLCQLVQPMQLHHVLELYHQAGVRNE